MEGLAVAPAAVATDLTPVGAAIQLLFGLIFPAEKDFIFFVYNFLIISITDIKEYIVYALQHPPQEYQI